MATTFDPFNPQFGTPQTGMPNPPAANGGSWSDDDDEIHFDLTSTEPAPSATPGQSKTPFTISLKPIGSADSAPDETPAAEPVSAWAKPEPQVVPPPAQQSSVDPFATPNKNPSETENIYPLNPAPSMQNNSSFSLNMHQTTQQPQTSAPTPASSGTSNMTGLFDQLLQSIELENMAFQESQNRHQKNIETEQRLMAEEAQAFQQKKQNMLQGLEQLKNKLA